MSRIIYVIYENGVFRPTQAVDLPDRCEAEVEIRQVFPSAEPPNLDAVYDILKARFETGEPDLAERHNEHQP